MLDADVVRAMSTPSIAAHEIDTTPDPYHTPSNTMLSSTPYTSMGGTPNAYGTPYSGMGGGVIRPAQASSYRRMRMSGTSGGGSAFGQLALRRPPPTSARLCLRLPPTGQPISRATSL